MKQEKLIALLDDMTLNEKIGQLLQISGNYYLDDYVLTGPEEELGFTDEMLSNCGSILNVWGAEDIKKIQDKIMSGQPHHIPAIFMMDVINGYKTIYPIPLAQGCSFDKELVRKGASMSAKETAVSGGHLTFSPMVDLVRDPRWGRVLESTGEDKYLNAVMGTAMIEGYQGEDPKESYKIGACVKHFAGYGRPEGGRDYNTVEMSKRTLYEDYLPAYEAGVKAGAVSVMTSFNVLDRIPSTGNKWLMRDVLRKQMGFDGVLISDYAAIEELVKHGMAEDEGEAARLALKAGVDIDMMTKCYSSSLSELIQKGEITEEELDEAVFRILTLKNKLGLFEHPYKDADEELEKQILLCEEHREVARQMAEESFVLLENDGILPLSPQGEKVAFIGPYCDSRELQGSWSLMSDEKTTKTLSEVVPAMYPNNSYWFEPGCNIAEPDSLIEGFDIDYRARYSAEEQELAMKRAEEIAMAADAVVLTLGEHRLQSGEAASRSELRLYEKQLELLHRVSKVNDNIIVVLFNGRPLDLKEIKGKAKAIVEAWFPGTEGASAIAGTLFGKVSPSGKLSMSFPYSVGQVPVYYSHLNTGRMKDNSGEPNKFCSCYEDIPNEPLYAFGYGLSYVPFSYSSVRLSKAELTKKQGDYIEARVNVTNGGDMQASEVVQLYIRDVKGSVARPVKELKGFEKITLQPGESREVKFVITEEMLRFYTIDMEYASESGEFHLFIGSDSRVEDYVSFRLV